MKNIFIALLIFVFVGCEKFPVILDNRIPNCIQDKIEVFEKEMNEICEAGAKVTQYKFQDETVYLFTPSNCFSDAGFEIFNRKCELICTLGTILGISDCRGEPFSNAEEIKVIWKQ